MSGLNLFDHFEEEDEPIVSNKHQSPKSEIRHEEKTSSISVSKFDSSSKRKMDEESENDNRKLQKKFSAMDILDNIDVNLLQNRVIITTVETIEACTHEVASPPDYKYEPLKISTGDPVRNYPFILDPFQKEAILCIENNQSVLVSAHTSAGKTVVAEYAIARSLSNNQRVIYTTPIKALSNQKYREFSEEFGDVGLVTGDVTINPNASCLIMTTEILRNMLYRGSEITREVGWVVFDEIHYMRDKQRGVVWEETLILLPDNVHYVFLSATIPNARQFAEWVCHLHHQPCHVVYTDYRPTPLQHFIFPAGGDGIHLVVDEKGQFKEDNFNAAMSVLQSGDAAKGDSQRGRHGGMKKNANDTCVFQVVKMIMERNFAPVIVFSFSKKDCELYAMQMTKLDFNTVEEKKLVDEVFNNAMDVLSEEDKRIPQVENVLPFLRRGIGIHHGGLLPILKETIEIMFGEGLIKALFATETFAMGLNMPARTVLFTGMRKFDGKNYRWLTSGEYIQMSGRAGRRGLDESGIVILMIDEKVSPSVGKDMVQGKPDPINSEFHLTYNMVLNLLRVEEINPEYMMERSFFQFQNQAAIPDLYSRYEDKFKEYHNFHIEDEVKIKSYHTILKTVNKLSIEHRNFITKPQYLIPFLHPGRLVKVKQFNEEFDWGVIVNHKKSVEFKSGPRKNKNDSADTVVIVDILLHIKPNSKQEDESLKPCPPGEAGDVEVVPVLSKLITHISSVRVHLPSDLRPLDARRSVLKVLQQVKKRFSDGPPLLNPVTDMQISEPDFLKINEDMNKFQKRLKEHPLYGNLKINEMLEEYEKKFNCGLEMERLASELKKAKSLLQMDELKNRKKVLRRLGYCDETDVIQLKGRIACELSSADELLITEMIFNGIFDNLDPSLSVSLLSCFVCDEKSQQMPARAEELSGPLRKMQDLARRIAKVSKDSKLNIEEDEYVEQFKPFLMDVVYAWCNGSSFVQLCKMTDVFEGSIIRCMRRLEELLRQLCQAAKSIGNVDLENKFSEGIRLIKRDIVFAASLYL